MIILYDNRVCVRACVCVWMYFRALAQLLCMGKSET